MGQMPLPLRPIGDTSRQHEPCPMEQMPDLAFRQRADPLTFRHCGGMSGARRFHASGFGLFLLPGGLPLRFLPCPRRCSTRIVSSIRGPFGFQLIEHFVDVHIMRPKDTIIRENAPSLAGRENFAHSCPRIDSWGRGNGYPISIAWGGPRRRFERDSEIQEPPRGWSSEGI